MERSLCSGTACPIYHADEPLGVVASLPSSWLTMHEHAAARGYACLVCRTHAVEVHDLPEPAAIAFMQDLRSVSKALSATTGAIKLNHEIHGNTLPHLHVHIYPRYIGDRFGDGPIDPRAVVPAVYGTGEFMCLRNAVIAALSRPRDNGVPCTD